ncbi:hypothetical protein EDD15DRAFT_2375474 [Pisolithus albus]|nr:hypothetical protein EDD15DRAFT_2375474 [Pisolithus albus]
MTFPHPKLQPSRPSANREWLSAPRSAPVNRDDSSDSDIATSNFFSTLRVSSLPTSPIPSPIPSDDSDPQPSSSKPSRKRARETPADRMSTSLESASKTFVERFHQAQNERSEVKRHRIDFNYWKTQERMSDRDAERQHQLSIQREKFTHKEVMAARELERVKLEIELEKLRVQALALQKGVAGVFDRIVIII